MKEINVKDMQRRRRKEAVENFESKKKKKKKRGYIRYYIMLILFVAVAVTTLSVTVFFNVSEVTVNGIEKLSTQEIITLSGAGKGSNLFRLNSKKIEETMLAGSTAIDAVKVEKSFPDKLVITVTETTPQYSVETDAGYVILSKNLRVIRLSQKKAEPKSVSVRGIKIEGYNEGELIEVKKIENFDIVANLMKEFSDKKITKIQAIDLSDILEIKLNYNSQYFVEFGTMASAGYKLEFVKEIIKQNNDDAIGVINVKYKQPTFDPQGGLFRKSEFK